MKFDVLKSQTPYLLDLERLEREINHPAIMQRQVYIGLADKVFWWGVGNKE